MDCFYYYGDWFLFFPTFVELFLRIGKILYSTLQLQCCVLLYTQAQCGLLSNYTVVVHFTSIVSWLSVEPIVVLGP